MHCVPLSVPKPRRDAIPAAGLPYGTASFFDLYEVGDSTALSRCNPGVQGSSRMPHISIQWTNMTTISTNNSSRSASGTYLGTCPPAPCIRELTSN